MQSYVTEKSQYFCSKLPSMRLFENDKGYMPSRIFEFCKLDIDLFRNNFALKMKAIIDFFSNSISI